MPSEQDAFSPELWSDMAAVRRTVEWHSVEPKRVAQAKFMGATCVRLLDRCLTATEMPESARLSLEKIKALMVDFDGLDADAREASLAAARSLLSELVSIGELGARHKGRKVRSRLSRPSGRDRKPRRERKEDPAKEPQDKPDDGSEPKAAEAKASAEPSQGDEAGENTPETTPETVQEAKEPAQADAPRERGARDGNLRREPRRPRPPAAPPRLALGHPEGTGRAVTELDDCTEELGALLETAGIRTVLDLIYTAPKEHVRVSMAALDAETVGKEAVLVRGKVVQRTTRFVGGSSRREVVLSPKNGGQVRAVWVTGAPRGWSGWSAGLELALAGVPAESEGGWELIESEPVGMDGRGSGLLPVYGLEGIDDISVRNLVAGALIETVDRLREPLPRQVVERYKLVGLGEALRDAHFPSNASGRGRARLAFDEMLMLQAGIAWRGKARQPGRGISHKILHSFVGDLGSQQDLVLSDVQEMAFSEIRRDLQSHHPMVRLLQGEAGTDKSRVALLSAASIGNGNTQVAWIMPDADAAERRCLFAEGALRSVGISSMLVTGAPGRGPSDAIKRGNSQVVFGTHELLDAQLDWGRLGLVIVEERESYGTVDPAKLVKEGPAPDLLVITDTPIPSSLTLTIFGEYQVTMIGSEGNQSGSFTVFPVSQRADAYAEAREVVEKGGQAYVVFPVGADGDLLGVDDALRYAEALQGDAFPGGRIGVYCSAMSRDERLRVYSDFEQRRIDVLVCTTFIEEAPVVPSATAMVLEHADKNALIRLHRLRGHVGHGNRGGRTIAILSDEPSEEGTLRVERIAEERDGFRIAEMDLQERGLDRVLGDRATEAPVFHWADPVRDRELLLRAREESFRLVRQDPGMRRWTDFGSALRLRWGEWLGEGLPENSPRPESGGSAAEGSASGRRRRRRRRRR
jgi:ATP-dependent DNA helicase RecG